jgi:hypothetical protein
MSGSIAERYEQIQKDRIVLFQVLVYSTCSSAISNQMKRASHWRVTTRYYQRTVLILCVNGSRYCTAYRTPLHTSSWTMTPFVSFHFCCSSIDSQKVTGAIFIKSQKTYSIYNLLASSSTYIASGSHSMLYSTNNSQYYVSRRASCSSAFFER